jgi:carboxymethylenebutenolidase
MCMSADSRPPIEPGQGAAETGELTLEAADGNRAAAWRARARAETRTGTGVLVFPDQRGLQPYYRELAERFAELGYDALAIDPYGRTAGASRRDASFEEEPHIRGLTSEGLLADTAAGVAALRSERGGAAERVVIVGFCLGGRIGLLAASSDLGVDGVVGFYGRPTGPIVWGGPAPIERIADLNAPILGLFAGADQYIPTERVEEYREALAAAGADAEVVIYPGAPHSFFDILAEEYADASADAWRRTLAFLERVTSGSGRSS